MDAQIDRSRWLAALLILFATAWTFSRYGDQEELFHDHGIIVYAGQQVLEGQPPYVGIFDHKGPGAALLCAAGVAFGELVGTDDLRGVRFLFLWISAACAAAMYLLTKRLFGSSLPAWLAAAACTCYWSFSITAYSGPEPKTPMVLCQVLTLLWAAERRWFAAGLAASGAFLVWQPMAVYGLVLLIPAWAHDRGRGVARAVAGGALPLVLVAVYYALHGASYALLDGVFLFNLQLMENQASLYNNLRSIQQAMLLSYKPAGLVLGVGLFAMLPLALWRLRRFGGAFARDPFFCLLVSFPAPVAWSLLDFQGGPDFFVFLPYATLGFAWLVSLALEQAADLAELDVGGRVILGGGAALTIWCCGWILMDALGPARLGDQRRALAAFEQTYGDRRIGTVGVPQALVLLERDNPTRYGFMMRGIANHVEARFEGGFEGWLAALERDVDVLLTTDMAGFEMGRFEERWRDWLTSRFRQEENAHGRAQVWVRQP